MRDADARTIQEIDVVGREVDAMRRKKGHLEKSPVGKLRGGRRVVMLTAEIHFKVRFGKVSHDAELGILCRGGDLAQHIF